MTPDQTIPHTVSFGPAKNGRHRAVTREREVLSALTGSAMRIASLQVRMWLTQTKITVTRIAIMSVASGIAALLGLAGFIFLYVGCYRVLTDVFHFRTVWACMIFAAFHLVLIGIVMGIAKLLVRRRNST